MTSDNLIAFRPLMSVIAGTLVRGVAVASIALASVAREPAAHGHKPKEGFVPNAATAVSIAVAVWTPIYGAESISRQKPYRARLDGDTWVVEGSLSPGMVGGVARAEISKTDGRILRVTHGK
jgi:hypothetical protein